MHRLVRIAFSFGVGALGTAGVVGLVVAMNRGAVAPTNDGRQAAVSFQVAPPTPKKTKPRARPRPKPKKRSSKPPPPSLSPVAGLTGLDFGLDAFGTEGGDALNSLLGDISSVVMTSDTVDVPPQPQRTIAPDYPSRARKQGTTGEVRLSLLVGIDGRVRDVRVLSAEPPGVFDQAAIAAVRQWTYSPATYDGQTVATRVTQPVVFALGR